MRIIKNGCRLRWHQNIKRIFADKEKPGHVKVAPAATGYRI